MSGCRKRGQPDFSRPICSAVNVAASGTEKRPSVYNDRSDSGVFLRRNGNLRRC